MAQREALVGRGELFEFSRESGSVLSDVLSAVVALVFGLRQFRARTGGVVAYPVIVRVRFGGGAADPGGHVPENLYQLVDFDRTFRLLPAFLVNIKSVLTGVPRRKTEKRLITDKWWSYVLMIRGGGPHMRMRCSI